MIEDDESNPIAILFSVMTAIIVMGLVLIVAGTIIDKNLNVFETVIKPNLGSWGLALYADLVTDLSNYVFIIPGFIVLVFLVWGVKASIKKQTYGRRDDEFLSGDIES